MECLHGLRNARHLRQKAHMVSIKIKRSGEGHIPRHEYQHNDPEVPVASFQNNHCSPQTSGWYSLQQRGCRRCEGCSLNYVVEDKRNACELCRRNEAPCIQMQGAWTWNATATWRKVRPLLYELPDPPSNRVTAL